jgi:hypothetical protein
MSRTENLQKIKDACWKANPEIKDLVFGCKVKAYIQDEEAQILQIQYLNAWDLGIEVECEEIDTEAIRSMQGDEDNYIEILGRDIRLADVLNACTPDRQPVRVDGNGIITSLKADVDGQTPIVDQQRSWNLLKDNLDEQSDETILFIANLLK